MKSPKNYQYGSSKRRWPRVLLGFVVVVIVLLVGGAWAVRQSYYMNLRPVSDSTQSQTVTVDAGATAEDVAVSLQNQKLIRAAWAFEWYVRSHNLRDKLQAGAYTIQPNQSVADIVDMIVNGKVATNLFTILPGQRLDQIKKAFLKAGYTEAEVDAALNPDLYKDHPALVDKPDGASLEGYLYPDSFQKITTTSPSTIIRQSLDLMQQHLTPQVRAGFVQQGLTVHQGVILASMVEQEVGKPADRPIVAQVFLKRLRTGMTLGSDVTAFYGAIVAGQTPSVSYDSPYNTRLHTGLPAGPISNVSGNSLEAVAFPANTDYLFFVTGDNGNTYFSNTEAEHEALAKQYCVKLCNSE